MHYLERHFKQMKIVMKRAEMVRNHLTEDKSKFKRKKSQNAEEEDADRSQNKREEY